MKTSLYTSAFRLHLARGLSFDVRDALSNWSLYADEIVFACGDEESEAVVARAVADLPIRDQDHPTLIKTIRTSFDFTSDPFAYGKTENAAMQACTGDLLLQANLDERWRVDKAKLGFLHDILINNPGLDSFFVPTIDLYGAPERCVLPVKAKWYLAKGHAGLKRGAVGFAIKADGHPDYSKTSSDELLKADGQLATTAPLWRGTELSDLREYVTQGNPLVYHLGHLDLVDRADRARWWGEFWTMATNGDPNDHVTDVAELERRHTFEHGLPLWPTKDNPL